MVLLKIFPFGFEIISYLSYKSGKRILIIFTQIHQLFTFYHTSVRTRSPYAMPAHARAHTHVIFLNNTNAYLPNPAHLPQLLLCVFPSKKGLFLHNCGTINKIRKFNRYISILVYSLYPDFAYCPPNSLFLLETHFFYNRICARIPFLHLIVVSLQLPKSTIFLSLSLTFGTVTVLRSTGQLFCSNLSFFSNFS